MRPTFLLSGLIAFAGVSSMARADVFENYESLNEGFLGTSFTSNGVTYRDTNHVAGKYADGVPFELGELGDELIIENATLFYNDFPTFGSSRNAFTFGNTYISGDNLSIGVLASVYMDLAELGQTASLDLAFYENGPWGGVEYRLEALLNGNVVATDSYVLADGGGRDNPSWETLSVSGTAFDSLHLYAFKDGEYSAPRGMIDNLTIQAAPVPEPATMAALGLGALALIRKRKNRS